MGISILFPGTYDDAVKTLYTVADICTMTGVTRKTLFYYDRIGLLKPAERTGPQNSKLYDSAGLCRLRDIVQYRAAGLKISEIRALQQDSTDRRAVLEAAMVRLLEEKEQKEEQIALLQSLLDQ